MCSFLNSQHLKLKIELCKVNEEVEEALSSKTRVDLDNKTLTVKK
jgi:hypothetical protein